MATPNTSSTSTSTSTAKAVVQAITAYASKVPVKQLAGKAVAAAHVASLPSFNGPKAKAHCAVTLYAGALKVLGLPAMHASAGKPASFNMQAAALAALAFYCVGFGNTQNGNAPHALVGELRGMGQYGYSTYKGATGYITGLAASKWPAAFAAITPAHIASAAAFIAHFVPKGAQATVASQHATVTANTLAAMQAHINKHK